MRKVQDGLFRAVMGLFAFSYVLAFGWAVLACANTHQGIVLHPFEWPEKWQWVNYIDVMELLEVRGVDFWGMIINTLIILRVFLLMTASFLQTADLSATPASISHA